MKTKPLKICFDRVIPDTMAHARHLARRSTITDALMELGAVNPRSAMADLNPNLPGVIGRPRMALINSRKWETGMTVRCRFLHGSNQQKAGVIKHAETWMEHANLRLKFVESGDAEVRIAFISGDGSWSAVGTDALVESYFPKHQPTMNYGWLEDGTSDSEYRRVVLHEFGHAIGCVHEHQSPNETLDWDKEAVFRYFSGSPNFWSKADIDHNVLRKYSPEGMSATIFDPKSIMLYQFAAELFSDGEGTPSNTKLSDMDKRMIREMYPFPAKPQAARATRGGTRAAAAPADAGSPPTSARANELLRESIKQAIFAPALPVADYERLTIADVRRELEEALAPEVDPEANRLMHLNVALRRRFRHGGWIVEVPSTNWYVAASRQASKASVIADYILLQPIQSV